VHPVLHDGSVAHAGSVQPTLPLQLLSTGLSALQLSVVGVTEPAHWPNVEISPLFTQVCVPSLHVPTFRLPGSPV
jgi:hypothetical protein